MLRTIGALLGGTLAGLLWVPLATAILLRAGLPSGMADVVAYVTMGAAVSAVVLAVARRPWYMGIVVATVLWLAYVVGAQFYAAAGGFSWLSWAWGNSLVWLLCTLAGAGAVAGLMRSRRRQGA